jgi:hypothetical protein
VEFVGDFSAKALVAEFRWLWFEVMEQSRIDARLGSVCAMHGADRPGNHDETVEAIERLLPCCFESGSRGQDVRMVVASWLSCRSSPRC